MKFTCNQLELTRTLNIVSKAISSRTTIPTLKGINIDIKSGIATFTASDMDITIENSIEVANSEDGSIVVHAKLFVDIQNLTMRADVSNLPENITLSVEGMVEGDHIFAKDIKLPKGAELVLDNLEESVVSVTVPAEEAAAPAGDTETAGETPAAESDSSESAE